MTSLSTTASCSVSWHHFSPSSRFASLATPPTTKFAWGAGYLLIATILKHLESTPSAKPSSKFLKKQMSNTESFTKLKSSSFQLSLYKPTPTFMSPSCPIHIGFDRPGLSRAFINNGQANNINSGTTKPEGIKRPEISLAEMCVEPMKGDVILLTYWCCNMVKVQWYHGFCFLSTIN